MEQKGLQGYILVTIQLWILILHWKCVTIVENKYGWEEEEVATFMFFYRLVYWVGLWAGVPLLSRIFQLSDNIIAIIASITTTAGVHVHRY